MLALTLFRPFRLFMTGAQLRRARILLLKATHWPYVAAIYAFENIKRRFDLGSHNEGLYSSKVRSNKHPLLRNHDASKLPRNSRPKSRSQASNTSRSWAGDGAIGHAHEREFLGEIRQVKTMIEKLGMQEALDTRLRAQEAMMEKLSTQVEELTRRLAKPENA